LKEAGFEPVWFVATSMGAVVAAGLAGGMGNDELLERMAEIGPRGIVRDRWTPVAGLFLRSLLKPAPLRAAVESIVPARRFGDLTIPLTVTAVDLDTGELVLFGSGAADAPLVDALCASCALPLYYPPVVLNGRRFGDGGLRAVLPLEPAAELKVELVLAVDVGPGFDLPPAAHQSSLPPLLRAHDDAVGILMAANTQSQLALWRADPDRRSNGTRLFEWIGYGNTPTKDAGQPARRWSAGAVTLDPFFIAGKLSP
jgi:NTE family protein